MRLNGAQLLQSFRMSRAGLHLRFFTRIALQARRYAQPSQHSCSSPSARRPKSVRSPPPSTTRLLARRWHTTSRSLASPAATPILIENEGSESHLPQAMVNDMPNQEIVVDFNNGDAIRYPSFWLRDHCPCPVCRHPSTHQRQIDTFTIDPSIKVSTIHPTMEGLQVTWFASPGESTHTSLFPWTWLQTYTPFPSRSSTNRSKRTWQQVSGTTPHASLPTVPYEAVMAGDLGLKELVSNIHLYGICFISSTPPTPEATEKLLNRIAFIRLTHYGGFWDFTSEVNPIDTAYTNLELPLHTDNTYFTDPAGLQLFHCLSHVSSAIASSSETDADLGKIDTTLGGESTFSDGIAAASDLFTTDKPAYTTLSTYPIASSAEGSPAGSFFNTSLSSSGSPVLVHTNPHPSPVPSTLKPSALTQIRWNNCDRSALTQFPSHQAMKSWYRAARVWEETIRDPRFQITIKLIPGMPVIFDNWRVLHGRKAFEGKRRVCGGYIGMDDFSARARQLHVLGV